MDEKLTREYIGMKVLASDVYWGSYTGVLERIFNTSVGQRARVRIAECVVYPSQHAVIFKENKFARLPYERGSTSNFDLCKVQLYEWDE